jgi:hypothetical protein
MAPLIILIKFISRRNYFMIKKIYISQISLEDMIYRGINAGCALFVGKSKGFASFLLL